LATGVRSLGNSSPFPTAGSRDRQRLVRCYWRISVEDSHGAWRGQDGVLVPGTNELVVEAIHIRQAVRRRDLHDADGIASNRWRNPLECFEARVVIARQARLSVAGQDVIDVNAALGP
jgi:hypothetical protein